MASQSETERGRREGGGEESKEREIKRGEDSVLERGKARGGRADGRLSIRHRQTRQEAIEQRATNRGKRSEEREKQRKWTRGGRQRCLLGKNQQTTQEGQWGGSLRRRSDKAGESRQQAAMRSTPIRAAARLGRGPKTRGGSSVVLVFCGDRFNRRRVGIVDSTALLLVPREERAGLTSG